MKCWKQSGLPLIALVCLALVVCSAAWAKSVMVPMKDGVKLRTIISLPAGGSCPAVLTRGYSAGDLP